MNREIWTVGQALAYVVGLTPDEAQKFSQKEGRSVTLSTIRLSHLRSGPGVPIKSPRGEGIMFGTEVGSAIYGFLLLLLQRAQIGEIKVIGKPLGADRHQEIDALDLIDRRFVDIGDEAAIVPIGDPSANLSVWTDIRFYSDEIKKLEVARDANETTVRKRAGAKPKYDWDAAKEALLARIAKHGCPKLTNEDGWRCQADVEQWLGAILEKGGNKRPGESQLRKKARSFLDDAIRMKIGDN